MMSNRIYLRINGIAFLKTADIHGQRYNRGLIPTELFFSPSSCSQLLKHSNGNIYWLGNITPNNAIGNAPRYPFIIGQVDSATGLLIRETIIKIDDRQPDEAKETILSNFVAYEERQTRKIILHMSRFLSKGNWNGDAYLYRIKV